MPIILLVNYRNAPCYKISQLFGKKLHNTLTLENDRSIKHDMDLVRKIKEVTIETGTKFISFDICDL